MGWIIVDFLDVGLGDYGRGVLQWKASGDGLPECGGGCRHGPQNRRFRVKLDSRALERGNKNERPGTKRRTADPLLRAPQPRVHSLQDTVKTVIPHPVPKAPCRPDHPLQSAGGPGQVIDDYKECLLR